MNTEQLTRAIALQVLTLWEAPEVVVKYLATADPNLQEEAHGEASFFSKHTAQTGYESAAATSAMWACGSAAPEIRLKPAMEWAAIALQEWDVKGEIARAVKAEKDAKASVQIAMDEWKRRGDEKEVVRKKVYDEAYQHLLDELGLDLEKVKSR